MKYPALAGSLMLALLLGRLDAQTPPPGSTNVIPAVAFFEPPDFYAPALSPNGQFIGFIGRIKGHACLFTLDRTSGKIQGLFSPGQGQVERFWWKGDHRVLIAARGQSLEYFVQEVDGLPRNIQSLKWVNPECINPLPRDIDHVIAFPGRYGSRVMVYDLRTGKEKTVETLQGDENDCVTSLGGELRAVTLHIRQNWRVRWRSSAKAPWHECKGKGDSLPFRPFAIDADDRHLLVFGYDQGDTMAVMRLDPDSDQRTLVVQYPDCDVREVIISSGCQVPTCVTSYRFGGDESQVLDEGAKPFYASLVRSLPGLSSRWISSSADGNLRIVYSWSGRDAGRYYLFDSNRKTLALLGERQFDLPSAAMGEVRPFTYKTRDAVSESGYVVLPAKAQPRPPLLVMPMQFVGESADPGRDFNRLAQFFASRGFAVVNFAVRGSFGFGRQFEKAGDFQVDGKIVQDIEDGVNYLAKEGLVDGKRVGILGWEEGGLIALRMAASSTHFGAVAIVNSPDSFDVRNVSLLTSSRAPRDAIIDQLGGGREIYEKFTRVLDPEASVKSLTVPAFVAYSSWFDSTPIAAGRIRSYFERFKKPYEWYEFDTHLANRPGFEPCQYEAKLYTKIVDFLQRTL